MKKKEYAELLTMSVESLREKENDLRRELFSHRLSSATSPAKDNQVAKRLRRDVARVMTVLQKKRAEQ